MRCGDTADYSSKISHVSHQGATGHIKSVKDSMCTSCLLHREALASSTFGMTHSAPREAAYKGSDSQRAPCINTPSEARERG